MTDRIATLWRGVLIAATTIGCGPEPEPFPNDLCEWLEAEARAECTDPERCIRIGCTDLPGGAVAGGPCEFVYETAITNLETLEEARDWCLSLRRGAWGSGPPCGVPAGDTDPRPIQGIVACQQLWHR